MLLACFTCLLVDDRDLVNYVVEHSYVNKVYISVTVYVCGKLLNCRERCSLVQVAEKDRGVKHCDHSVAVDVAVDEYYILADYGVIKR